VCFSDGSLFWNVEPVPKASLIARFVIEAKKDPQPELHIKADKLAHYENVAIVMSDEAKTKRVKIGFVTDPTLNQLLIIHKASFQAGFMNC
jgi:biopolymer transport protein ExbD